DKTMTRVQLDPNLKEAIAVGTPVEVVDPATNQVYYLIAADLFLKMSATLSGHFDPLHGYPLIDLVMADDDAHDPLLDSYQ
ncbi:MAG: hypothetical protein AB7I48_21480, partial [Planctomycetaceae bacterium]